VQKDIDHQLSEDIEALRAEEAAVLSFLRARIEGLTMPETQAVSRAHRTPKAAGQLARSIHRTAEGGLSAGSGLEP
jgi:hypothetical protein